MKPKVENIKEHIFTPEDKLLFDTNIWLFLYGPRKPRDPKVKTYSEVLQNILGQGSAIYADVLIMSEYINNQFKNVFHLEHSRHRSSFNGFANMLSAITAYIFHPNKPTLQFSDEDRKVLMAA